MHLADRECRSKQQQDAVAGKTAEGAGGVEGAEEAGVAGIAGGGA